MNVKHALHVLLALSLTGSLAGEELKLQINGRVPETGGRLEETNAGWKFTYRRKLAAADSAGKELLLNKSGWKKHPQSSDIAGYNGDIALKIKAPGKILVLKAMAEMTNYADSEKRGLYIACSLNGADYKEIAFREFGGGSGKAEAEIKLPDNRGFVWLKFGRKLKSDDANGKYGYVVFKEIGLEMTGTIASAAADAAAAGKAARLLKDVFPTGVFWPWEYTKMNAAAAHMEFWEFVDAMMKQLHEHGCNTVWFVNMDYSDMPKVLVSAEKHGMQVLLNTEALDAFYRGCGSLERVNDLAEKTAVLLKDYPALLGYVLKDEPLLCSLESCNFLFDLMKKADPDHDCVAVVMNRQSMSYLKESKLPVICTDLYYFGHDRSTNMPNPAAVSQRLITDGLEGYNTAAELYGKHFWFMGQMFGSIWGRHYVKDGKTIVEPGSYLHNRMPTHAETRWQIWEAVRNGSTGVFFFLFLSDGQLTVPPEQVKPGTHEAERVAAMDRNAKIAAGWKNQWLTDKRMVFDDPNDAMTMLGGKPVPQMETMSKAFKVLRANEKMLVKKKRAAFPVFFAENPLVETATFDAGDGKRYGVAVNHDLDRAQTTAILLPLNVKTVTNLNTGKMLKIQPKDDSFQQISLGLEAGDGVLLAAEFSGEFVGMPVCREKFDQHSIHRVKLYGNSEIFHHGAFGVDARRSIRLTGDASKPVFSLENLTNFQSAVNTFAMNLNSRKADGTIYCQIAGKLNSAVVKAVSAQKEGEKTNVSHLADRNFQSAEKSGGNKKSLIIQNKNFQIPAVAPVGTTSLEFYLKDASDYITELNVWFIPALRPE